jgi:hypothetical protein
MDLLTTVVVLLIAVALIGWVAAAIDGRPLEAFGSGFVGYRSYGWPQGVQEEDAIHFAPTAWHERPVDRRRRAAARCLIPSSSSSTTPLRRRSRSNVFADATSVGRARQSPAFCASLLQTAVLRCGRG